MDPGDLSLVADAVFTKTNSQRDVVERLCEQYDLKLATPNEGYLIAAAMLCEGVISSMVTLNFDLAISNALSQLGVGHMIGVIECPKDLPKQKNINVYYLHQNVNAADPEGWVLRTAALQQDWKGQWQPIITTKVLTAPVVVFAGLGTPVDVLIASTKLLRNALPAATELYQVDPVDKADSKYFSELALDPSAYIQLAWCQFMHELSQRLLMEQVSQLRHAVGQKIQNDGIPPENVSDLLDRLNALGLVKLGKLRAHWLLHEKPYCPADPNAFGLIADLILALAMIARVSGAEAVIVEDGLVEFHRDGRTVAAYLVASGRGHRGRVALEADVGRRRIQYQSCLLPPRGVIVGGTSDSWTTTLSPPLDVLRGEVSEEDIINGPSAFPLFHINDLRMNPISVQQVVP
jgi:hypothetical protein